jgi:hypothetical protein
VGRRGPGVTRDANGEGEGDRGSVEAQTAPFDPKWVKNAESKRRVVETDDDTNFVEDRAADDRNRRFRHGARSSQLIIVRIPRLVRGTRRRLPSPAPHTPARGIVRSRARSSRARPFGRPFARRGFATDAGSGRGGRGRCCFSREPFGTAGFDVSGMRGGPFRAAARRAGASRGVARARQTLEPRPDALARSSPAPAPPPAPRARSPTARTPGRFGRSRGRSRGMAAAAAPRARRSARRPPRGTSPATPSRGPPSPRPSRGRPRSSPRSRTSSARRCSRR